MTIEEIKAMLEAAKTNDGKIEEIDTLLEGVIDVVNSEKTKGQQAYKKKDKEVLKYKSVIKELGFDNDEGDVSSFVSGIKDKLTNTDKNKSKYAQMSEKLDDVLGELNKERDASKRLRQSNIKEKITNKLTKSIGDKLYGANYVIESLVTSGKVAMDEDNNIYFKDGDDVVTFDKGVAKVLEDNKDMQKVSQNKGTGKPGGDTTGGLDLDEMSVDDILANLDDVKKQVGMTK